MASPFSSASAARPNKRVWLAQFAAILPRSRNYSTTFFHNGKVLVSGALLIAADRASAMPFFKSASLLTSSTTAQAG